MNRVVLSSTSSDHPRVEDSASPRFSATPLAWVWGAVIAALLFLLVQTALATRVPTIGAVLAPGGADAGLRVERVYPGLPAERAGLEQGDVIAAIDGAGRELPLRDYLTLKDPDMAGSYATLAAFQRDVRAVTALMADGPVQLVLSDGSRLPLTAQPTRPLAQLPGWYWAISLMGIVALAIGVALKAHRPEDANTTQVLIAAVGFWMTAWSWPLYGTRELATPLAAMIAALEGINHLGFVIMIAAALALLWQYPVRIGPQRIWPLTFGVGLIIWCIMTFRLYEFPLHAFYVPLFCMPLIVAVTLAGIQWRLSRDRPLEKASLRWLLITMFGSTCGAFAMYVVPPLYGGNPLTPPWASQLILLIFFLGLALGAARYRLFEVESWWINTWLWFGMGVLIIVLDVALITFLKIGAAGSTALAVVIVAWIYFPLRQHIWKLVARSPDRSTWQLMPEIASRFARPLEPSVVAAELGHLFESIFDASDTVVLTTGTNGDKPRLTHHGLNMVIPVPHGDGQVLVAGKHRGRRLFDLADVEYANDVAVLVGQLVELAREHEAAERTERERIMRDLHDDVGAKLLSLVHGTHDPIVREEASDLLQTLRTSVIPLHNRRRTQLVDATAKWQVELTQRVADTGASLHWQETVSDAARLSARQYVNITRILRELLTNALKHAQPKNVWITISTDDKLTIRFTHDGLISDPEQWSWGRGQHNLATRAQEINGELHFALVGEEPEQHLEALLVMPL